MGSVNVGFMAYLMSLEDVGEALGVSVYTVRRLIGASQMKAVRISGRVLVSSVEVERVQREGAGGRRARTQNPVEATAQAG